ncbi:ABC transporter permease subunit [Solirubrobacter sp. CPCC 204708]|nr:ABC transporter permease subunit [Solirubrobacter deserti]
MTVYVLREAWPSFSANGLAWFGTGGDANVQLENIFRSEPPFEYMLRAWPLLYGTLLSSGGAVIFGLVLSTLTAVFIVEFAPPSVVRILEPVVRLLAGVPSVIYGLIGVLVLVPFLNDHLISTERKESVFYVIQLTGQSLLVATALLTIMIVPIMIAIAVDALRSVPSSWTEGALALGANRMRVMWTIALRAARPALVAGAVLALARALGEAIMLAMVSGGVIFAPNPLDGSTFFFEPIQPLAAAIVQGAEGITVKPYGQTLFAFAAVIMVSSVGLSITGWAVRRRLRRFAA